MCVCVRCTRLGKHACVGLLQAAANCSSGVVNEQQQCCASGLLDNSITCCDEGSALDGAGWCCPGGVVDACGVCNGTGTAVDVEGTCCNSTIDATGVCCQVHIAFGVWCQVHVAAQPLSGTLSQHVGNPRSVSDTLALSVKGCMSSARKDGLQLIMMLMDQYLHSGYSVDSSAGTA